MFCSNCGARLNDTDRFCPECGTKVEPAEAAPAVQEAQTEPAEAVSSAPEDVPAEGGVPSGPETIPAEGGVLSEPEPAPKKKHTALWIVLICAVLLAAAAAALLLWRPWSWKSKLRTMTPEKAITTALEQNNAAAALHTDLSETISASIGVPSLGYSQNMDITLVLGSDTQTDTGVSRTEGYMNAFGQKQSILIYTEKIDGELWSYSSQNDGKTWRREKQTDETNPLLQVASQATELWTKHAKDLKRTGTEMLDGTETTVFTGMLSGDFVKDATGMTGSLFGSPSEAVLNGIGDMPVTFWIDNENGRLVRMTVDMRDMMKTMLDSAMKETVGSAAENMELSVDVSTALIDCRMSRFDTVPEIVIPEEAKRAGESPAVAGDGIVGTWRLYGGEDDETQQYVDLMLGMGMDMVFVFNEDGTGSLSVTFNGESEENSFTWSLEDGEIVIDGTGAPYRIEDGLLHIVAEDTALIFQRSGE